MNTFRLGVPEIGKRLMVSRHARIAASLVILSCSPVRGTENWQSTLTKEPPGDFPDLRPLQAIYHFGWAGLTAATADVRISKPTEGRFQLEGVGKTVSLARALWRYDVNYHALADAGTLRPLESRQVESVRSKKATTQLAFTSSAVTRIRTEGPGAGTTKSRDFNFPNLFDLQSALLYLRSQSLKDRSVYHLVVYPNSAAYFATVTVLGREKISVRAGSYNAIKLDLQLNKIGKDLGLEPHRKFRRATVWTSDDPDRLILRIEAQVFVGTVFAELYSVRFESPK